MSIKGKAYIGGIYEHPTRKADDKSLPQLHAEVAKGALVDAGLSKSDIDGYFCAGDSPGLGGLSMIDYLGIKPRHIDSTETGGSSYVIHVAHAAAAIAAGKCNIALITLAGRPRAEGNMVRLAISRPDLFPEAQFEAPFGPAILNLYGMCAMRHMYEFGTTSEQLAWVKVAASHHAQYNPNAKIKIIGAGEASKNQMGGKVDLTYSGARWSGPIAFGEAGIKPSDIKYASIYDSFTITVLMTLEDLGFCEKGQGGRFVADGNLISGVGKLPFNTDGGGLCNNHPGNRGGMTKVIEAVRQLRGEAHPAVQVKDCDLALAHGTGGSLGTRHGSATLIMERE